VNGYSIPAGATIQVRFLSELPCWFDPGPGHRHLLETKPLEDHCEQLRNTNTLLFQLKEKLAGTWLTVIFTMRVVDLQKFFEKAASAM
jgi:hypothetical protein